MLTLGNYELVRDGKLKPSQFQLDFKVDWPESKKGPWSIDNFEVKVDMQNLRMMQSGRGCFPGVYTRLSHKSRGVVMSDTTAEAEDHFGAHVYATGRVLVHGLGLGCFVKSLLSKESVTNIDVVEIDEDVISLVGKHFTDSRVNIVHGDCLTHKWPAGTKWDFVWHDIWDELCEDNLPEMKKLHRKFGSRCKRQESWSRDFIE